MIDFGSLAGPSFSLAAAKSVTFPLLIFVTAIFIFAWLIFKFYRFLSNRDVFELNLQKYSESFMGGIQVFLNGFFYVLEFFLILPFFIFFWFAVIAVILVFLSKSSVEGILLVSMGIVGSVRIAAYYNEELSQDLSKILPFALLGVFLSSILSFSYKSSLALLLGFPQYWQYMVYYLAFIVLLELILRILYGIAVLARSKTPGQPYPAGYRPPVQRNLRDNTPGNQRIVGR